MASNWPLCMFRVRRHDTTPSFTALWLGTKKQRFCGTNQKPELPRRFGTGPLKLCPQGLFSSFLTFLRPNFFPAPSNCPWVSEDGFYKAKTILTKPQPAYWVFNIFFSTRLSLLTDVFSPRNVEVGWNLGLFEMPWTGFLLTAKTFSF